MSIIIGWFGEALSLFFRVFFTRLDFVLVFVCIVVVQKKCTHFVPIILSHLHYFGTSAKKLLQRVLPFFFFFFLFFPASPRSVFLFVLRCTAQFVGQDRRGQPSQEEASRSAVWDDLVGRSTGGREEWTQCRRARATVWSCPEGYRAGKFYTYRCDPYIY